MINLHYGAISVDRIIPNEFIHAAVMPLFVNAPALTIEMASFGLPTAPKMVADSNPQCIMQFAQRGSLSAFP